MGDSRRKRGNRRAAGQFKQMFPEWFSARVFMWTAVAFFFFSLALSLFHSIAFAHLHVSIECNCVRVAHLVLIFFLLVCSGSEFNLWIINSITLLLSSLWRCSSIEHGASVIILIGSSMMRVNKPNIIQWRWRRRWWRLDNALESMILIHFECIYKTDDFGSDDR